MKNNAVISARLEGLLEALDARSYLTIFNKREDGKEELLRSTPIYRLLADEEFIGNFKEYKVIGLTVILGHVNILIEEA